MHSSGSTSSDTNSDRLSEGVESLLTEHVRVAFREDVLSLDLICNSIDQVAVKAKEAKSRLKDHAMLRLDRLQICLDRAVEDCESVISEIRELEEDRENLRSLLGRVSSDRWTETERAEAEESASLALADGERGIKDREIEVTSLSTQLERLSEEAQSCVERKKVNVELEESLTSGREPLIFQEALTKETASLQDAFQLALEDVERELKNRRSDCLSAEADVSKLKKELEDARIRASELDAARNLGWLARRLDPRNILWRDEDEIKIDLDAQQIRLQAAQVKVQALKAKLGELSLEHDRQLETLPSVVRQKLIDTTRDEITKASARFVEIERLSDQQSKALAEQKSEIASQKAAYANAHQQQLKNFFSDQIRRAIGNLEEIETRIAAAVQRQLRAEKVCTRLAQMIERRRARLDAELLECERQQKSKLDQLKLDERRLRLRLRDRAPRASMIHDPATDTYREYDIIRNAAPSLRAFYRQMDQQPSPVASLPILLQRRAQTGYVNRDDERLTAVLASVLGEAAPSEEDRPAFIDHFCDIFFGDDQDERPFFVSIVSKERDNVLVLVRPAQVLPQLAGRLPEAMSVCLLCRLEYNSKRAPDNTTVSFLDVALVTDCEPRPFERTIFVVRHSSRNSLPVVASPLDELLEQAGVEPPKLQDDLQERLHDWQGYLDWANEQLLRRTPWAALGPGNWTNGTWEGVIFCEDKNALRGITGAGAKGDVRQTLEIYPLKEPWQRTGRDQTSFAYRCTDFRVVDSERSLPQLPPECPWAHYHACRVSMKFSPKDVSALAELPADSSFGLRNVTEVIGSQVQLSRYRNALADLQYRAAARRPGTRLTAAPYLIASLFNVAQAARPAAKLGRLLNAGIVNHYRLNEDQGSAVEVMLRTPEIAYIQGPPGTGKTTMIAAACAHFVRLGQRVLIASQTNLAVENALERLIEDPEVRPLWLSRTEGDQKKSLAISDWYRMAADHVEKVICEPFQSLSQEVKGMENWLERARALERAQRKLDSDLQIREEELRKSEAALNELLSRQMADSEVRARAKWWAMAYAALAELAEWDPSCFSRELASDASDLLKLFAAHDGSAPHLDVSPGALQRQAQERIQDLQSRLGLERNSAEREEAEQIRKLILDAWTEVAPSVQEDIGGTRSPTLTVSQMEVSVRQAKQSLDDQEVRANDITEKNQAIVSEISRFLDLPEVPTDLQSAIEIIERHADLKTLRLDDVDPLREWLPVLDQWVADLRQQAEDPSGTDRMGERFVRSANVVGITCNSDFRVLSDNDFSRFDVVIVDEVSKATPLELMRPMLLAPKTILVGDHRQLPPTFEFASFGPSDRMPTEDEDPEAIEREAELLRKYERLTTASLFRDGFSEIDPAARAALYTQYRMHPQIMSLVNRFYDGRLESGLPDPDGNDETLAWSWRTHGLNLPSRTGGQYLSPHQHALWIDSSEDERGKRAYEESDNAGIANKLEARLVAQIVEDIVDRCDKEQRKKTIAVATFYNRQKRLIRKYLEEKLGQRFRDLRIDVETVDRFQGKEADIVIVSMVRNRSRRLGRNSNPAKFERINVAFSRARDLLVVVGARKTFETFEVPIEPVEGGPPRRTCVYGQIIEDIRDAGGLWRAKDILGTELPRSKDRPA